jgi:WD40 repeat protein/serine/threonine protein kinase
MVSWVGMSDCLDDDTLLDFVEGRLPAGRVAEVDEHIADCAACRKVLAALGRGVAETPAEIAPRPEEGLRFEPGATVGAFSIMRRLGRGGMGEVFLARDTQLGRKVALKIIRPEQLGSVEARQRFLFEARTTARFNHPHIVTVYAVGEEGGHPYLALEYLEGQTLDQRLAEERPALDDILRIGQAVAEALAEAHRHGVLHRDLKPANVLIPRDGRLRVLDFGLAKTVGTADAGADEEAGVPAETFVSRGGLRGTPAYMAPEQWLAEACTPATDVWSLGVLLHEMVSGQVPFQGPLVLLRDRVTAGTPPPAPDHPEAESCGLSRLIQRCLRRDPGERPAADEVAEALAEMRNRRRAEGVLEGSPFRGLSPFGERHTGQFFGRDRDLPALLERLREQAVLPLTGPSGVGKSSLVRAGIFPRLRERGGWTLLAMQPGRHPFAALAERLVFGESTARSGSAPGSGDGEGSEAQWSRVREIQQELSAAPERLAAMLYRSAEEQRGNVLLFVDQLEELFTHGHEAELCGRFIRMLFGAADHPEDPVRVVLAVRDDFLYRVVEAAGQRGEASQISFVRSPDAAAMREILLRPLGVAGYAFDDPNLVEEIINDVQAEAASLPLLQFAAQSLWERRDRQRRLLCRADYEAMGGVGGALASYADGVIASLSPAQLRLARELLLRLVSAEGTRRVVAEDDLLEGLGDEAVPVLRRLTATRLVTTRKSRRAPDMDRAAELELVHEALIRSWARLARWAEEERESIGQLADASQAAELWARRGCHQEEVWTGEALRDAQRLLRLPAARVPPVVRRFLEAGLALDRRRRRRRAIARGVVVGTLALLALAAMIVAGFVSRKKHEADRQRARAERQLAAAQLRGARLAFLQQHVTEARVKLRASLEIEDSMAGRALWRNLEEEPLQLIHRLPSVVFAVAFSPDGRFLAAAGRDGGVHLVDLATRTASVLHRHARQILGLAFSPEGRHLASGDVTGAVHLFDRDTRQVRRLTGASGPVWRLAFGPDGALWSVGGADGSLLVWRPGHRDRLRPWPGTGSRHVNSLAVSADGARVAGGRNDGSTLVWDAASGAEIQRLAGHGRVYAVSFDGRGSRLATGGADRTIRIWDTATGRLHHTLRGHTDTVFDVRFSPDGLHLASSSHDRTIRLWDARSGTAGPVLRGHNAMVFGLSFAPGGELLASSGYDHTARVWRVKRPRLPGPTGGHSSNVLDVAFSPDGRLVATASGDRTVRLWDARTAGVVGELRGHRNSVSRLRFTPGGELLVTASYDQTVRLWEVAGRREVARLDGHTDKIRGLDVSPDGRWIASGGEDRTVRLWEVERRAPGPVLSGHAATVDSVAFSPDGRWLASTGMDRTIRIWRVDRRAAPVVLRAGETRLSSARFSPDGRRLAALGSDEQVHLWSVGTWRHQTVAEAGRGVRLAFHPDGGLLGVATVGDARLLEPDSGRRVTLAGHRDEVNAVVFDGPGRRVATASDDGTVRVWRVDSGAPLWRAPLLLRSPVELLSHRGWETLDNGRGRGPAAWRRAVETEARQASATGDGDTLCLIRSDGLLELWRTSTDRRALTLATRGARRVVALPGACALETDRGVTLLRPGWPPSELADRATLLGGDDGGLIIGQGEQVRLIAPEGTPLRRLTVTGRTLAAHRLGDQLLLGQADGRIRRLSLSRAIGIPLPALEQPPSTGVTRILGGPAGLIIAGFADGEVGIWHDSSGARLARGRLHGPVSHLLLERERLYAASEIGDRLAWGLEVLFMPYDRLLRDLRRQVPRRPR